MVEIDELGELAARLITPQGYEALVEDVCRQLIGNVDAKVYRNKNYCGISGHSHEIDVAVEFEVSGLRLLVLIECKALKRPVGIEEVMVLLQRLRDTGAHKGVIISLAGFRKGAIKIARANGVALVHFRGALGSLAWISTTRSSANTG